MNTTKTMASITCWVAWLLTSSSLALANKLPEPETTGGIGGTGNTPTTISETLLQPSGADQRQPCPDNLKVAQYHRVSAGTVSVSALCIGQEIALLHGDQLKIQLNNSSEVHVNALGRVRVGLLQTETQQGQAQNFDMVFYVDSGRVVISVGETRIEGTTGAHPRLMIRDGMVQ